MYRRNRRNHEEHLFVGHLKLEDLKVAARVLTQQNNYLFNENVPAAPPAEFHVSHLKHDTNLDGLCGIKDDSGFKNPHNSSLVWWSLAVRPDEITSAETRLLEKIYPDRTTEQVQRQQSFLHQFTTSPAFWKTSRLGSYRFTFPVEEVLEAYSEQFCSRAQPVMRMFRTQLYTQEVMYAVLVHSPVHQEQFSHLPLLSDDPDAICCYQDGCFIWRPQAMCGTHRYRFVLQPEEKQMEAQEVWQRPQFYVWDHVGIALHVDDQVLKFDPGRLRENLTFCERPESGPTIIPDWEFDDFSQAVEVVETLWPHCPSPLERAEQLEPEPWTSMDATSS